MKIDGCTRNDASTLLALLADLRLPTAGIEEHLDTAWVAREGETIVGCAALEMYGEAALLRSVAVRPEVQSRGIGRALMAHVLQEARRRGVKRVYLLTQTAERYFPRFGFVPIERQEVEPAVTRSVEFVSACPKSARAMRAELE